MRKVRFCAGKQTHADMHLPPIAPPLVGTSDQIMQIGLDLVPGRSVS